MGEAIEAAGGRVDKFIGDGIMALFGLDQDPPEGAPQRRSPRRAAWPRRWSCSTATRRSSSTRRCAWACGVHLGPAILGQMGQAPASALTAIGDTVNVASRLEALTKEFGCQLIVSERVIERAGMAAERLAERRELDLRGRDRAAGRTGWSRTRPASPAWPRSATAPGLATGTTPARAGEGGQPRVDGFGGPGRFPTRRATWLDTPRRKGRNIDCGP